MTVTAVLQHAELFTCDPASCLLSWWQWQCSEDTDYLYDRDLIQWVFLIDLLLLFGHRYPAGRICSTGNTSTCNWVWIQNMAETLNQSLFLSIWADRSCNIAVVKRLWNTEDQYVVRVCVCVNLNTHLRHASASLQRLHAPQVFLGGQACCLSADIWLVYCWPAVVGQLYRWLSEMATQLEAAWQIKQITKKKTL